MVLELHLLGKEFGLEIISLSRNLLKLWLPLGAEVAAEGKPIMTGGALNITVKKIQSILVNSFKIEASPSKIGQTLKCLGYRYRPMKARQLHVDSDKNKLSRLLYAKKLITILELRPKIVIYQIDVTGFNTTMAKSWAWIDPKVPPRSQSQRFHCVTLTITVGSDGSLFFNLLSGSNTA